MAHSPYPPEWAAISKQIRYGRAHNRCEWCDARNGEPHPVTGGVVRLAVAHLGARKADGSMGDKHDKADVRPENLACLCQRCHLRYDKADHLATRLRISRRKAERLNAVLEELDLSMYAEWRNPGSTGKSLAQWLTEEQAAIAPFKRRKRTMRGQLALIS